METITESALGVIERMAPAEIFMPETMDPILDRIKAEVRAVKTDISTEHGRKEIASLAYKVAKSKTFLDGVRKQLVEGEKKRLKAIDAEGARIWNELESLQKEVRKPLTDWEEAEESRVAAHEANLMSITQLGGIPLDATIFEVRANISELDKIDPATFQEFKSRATEAKFFAVEQLNSLLAKKIREEEDRAELARLRAEAEAREKKEREERIAREAREAAEREARERERKAAEVAERERQRLEDEKFQAEARAEQAEAQRIADATRAEREAASTAERAEREKQAAIESERHRIEAQQQREADEAAARERNKRHAANINREVRDALMEHGFQVSEAQAISIVKAIASGSIPHTKISY